MEKPVVALVDSPSELRRAVIDILCPHSFEVFEMESGQGVVGQELRRKKLELAVIAAFERGASGGLKAAARIRRHDLTLPLILVVTHSSEEQAIAALRLGINDYLKWPCTSADLLASVRGTLASRSARTLPRQRTLSPQPGIDQCLAGRSGPLCEIRDDLLSAALSDSNVLITGETGTGKERVAQLIHRYSQRHNKRLICINCAAVPESLLESELFGHEKGAFTGASAAYEGKLKLAEGGTVFFDEIGDMSLLAQTKILRAVECKEVYRLGGREGISLDFRVVAATNGNLERLMEEGAFRKDLYYRLNVARLHLPPLRERKEDIPLLIRHHLQELNGRLDCDVQCLDDECMELLLRYDWPGNVRELRNVIEAALIKRPFGMIRVTDLPREFCRAATEVAGERTGHDGERDALLAALVATNWNKSRAAEKLKLSRMTIYRKMRKYQIQDEGPG